GEPAQAALDGALDLGGARLGDGVLARAFGLRDDARLLDDRRLRRGARDREDRQQQERRRAQPHDARCYRRIAVLLGIGGEGMPVATHRTRVAAAPLALLAVARAACAQARRGAADAEVGEAKVHVDFGVANWDEKQRAALDALEPGATWAFGAGE